MGKIMADNFQPSDTKTISNLGIEPYIRYEDDRRYFEPDLSEKENIIHAQVVKDSLDPIYISEYDALFSLGRTKSFWSKIIAPESYVSKSGRIFMHCITPALRNQELVDSYISKIENLVKSEQQKRQKFVKYKTKEQEVVDVEGETLVSLLENVQKLHRIVETVDNERFRYSKG